jgi:hypothetical protein
MLRSVALVRTDVSEERIISVIRVTIIGEQRACCSEHRHIYIYIYIYASPLECIRIYIYIYIYIYILIYHRVNPFIETAHLVYSYRKVYIGYPVYKPMKVSIWAI